MLLKNIYVNENLSWIHVKDGLIAKIGGAGEPQPQDDEIIDCGGKTAMPGFVNMHIHAAMSLLRGVGEDMAFHQWLDKIWKIEANIDEEFVYWGTKVACLEMLRTGTTTFSDHYWFSPAGHRAAAEMGLNPVVSYVVIDKNDPAEAEREKIQIQKMYEKSLQWPDNHTFAAGFHAIYSVSEEMIRWTYEFARARDLKLHFHLSETQREVQDCIAKTGLTPVQYLDRLGVLDENSLAAHTLWLTPEDIEILGRRKVNCVHNINSNLKLASGYKFLYNELHEAGANVCIGTDGSASSNNLCILEALKTAAIVQKAWREDPCVMPLNELIDMATINGAKALGHNTGALKEGMSADIIIVDTNNSFFLSSAPFLANFLYSAHSDCITDVLCKGRLLMHNREIPGEAEILSEARRVLKNFKY